MKITKKMFINAAKITVAVGATIACVFINPIAGGISALICSEIIKECIKGIADEIRNQFTTPKEDEVELQHKEEYVDDSDYESDDEQEDGNSSHIEINIYNDCDIVSFNNHNVENFEIPKIEEIETIGEVEIIKESWV